MKNRIEFLWGSKLPGSSSEALVEIEYSCYHQNRVPKCDVIKFSFFAFRHFHDHMSAEHDEKPSHTKFDMNWFMVARDMAA